MNGATCPQILTSDFKGPLSFYDVIQWEVHWTGGTINVNLSSNQVANLQSDKFLGLHDVPYKMKTKISQLISSCGSLGRSNTVMDVALGGNV